MGSSQSLLSPEAAITVAVVAGAIGLGYKQLVPAGSALGTTNEKSGKKEGKKKKHTGSQKSEGDVQRSSPPPTPIVVPFPTILPGGYDGTTTTEADSAPEAPKRKGKKKKKSKLASSTSSTQPEAAAPKRASTTQPSVPADKPVKEKQGKRQDQPHSLVQVSSSTSSPETHSLKHPAPSTASLDTDGSWTRVESRRNRTGPSVDLTTTSASEADAPITGSSSPVAERTEDDDEQLYTARSLTEPRRPLAERLLPKPRKTGVDEFSILSPSLVSI